MQIHDDSVPKKCPHCGRELSPWERVLLSVDRALMCKGCWYRILLDAFENPHPKQNGDHSSESEEKD